MKKHSRKQNKAQDGRPAATVASLRIKIRCPKDFGLPYGKHYSPSLHGECADKRFETISSLVGLPEPTAITSGHRRQFDCKRFITNRGDIISALLWSVVVRSGSTTTNPPLRTTTLHNNALMMSPRLVMKRLQSNCPAQRTSQRPPYLRKPIIEMNLCPGARHKRKNKENCKKSFIRSTISVPNCHAIGMKHEDWDTAKFPKPTQGKSRDRGRVRTTDFPVSKFELWPLSCLVSRQTENKTNKHWLITPNINLQSTHYESYVRPRNVVYTSYQLQTYNQKDGQDTNSFVRKLK
ncbi:hypothetical protein T265_00299 [Opisthorchis viverrini]|uniref:Uncharacterized protein n=1 Tax=Opisthorchis viverrini TaxID=6198 RepID=A0A075A686_OPIVI|nr:hypothetical protein T265_00299 [Opisthorchis viverrini]KER33852.1 hypothetical protein T265_00299 [Opisthorchis viverrini]